MEYRIEIMATKKLAGKRMTMSYANNKTKLLWQSFMPRRKELKNTVSNDLFSIQLYPEHFFKKFDPLSEFEKWAALEVKDHIAIPDDIEAFTLPGGLYAVFEYHGSSTDAAQAFQYILGTWLPASDYILDDRPHFEILGDKYKTADPDSEEEIWIPIKSKK